MVSFRRLPFYKKLPLNGTIPYGGFVRSILTPALKIVKQKPVLNISNNKIVIKLTDKS